MKRICIALLAMVLLLSVTACSFSDQMDKIKDMNETNSHNSTEVRASYQYASEHLQSISFLSDQKIELDGKIDSVVLDRKGIGECYVYTTDNNLYHAYGYVTNWKNATRKLELQYGAFEGIYPVNTLMNREVLAIRDKYKLHVNGTDENYYFNPEYTPILFSTKYHMTEGSSVDILSVNSDNQLIYQACKPDGTVEEHLIEYINADGTPCDINFIQAKYCDVNKFLLLDADGVVYMASHGQYDTAQNGKIQYKVQAIANNNQLTNVAHMFTQGGANCQKMIYGNKSNDKSLHTIVDWDKNEVMEIPLPEGKTVDDIVLCMQTNDAFADNSIVGRWLGDVIIIFNDNSVYYGLKDNFKTLTYHEELTKINQTGALLNIFSAGDNYYVIMDDNNLYKIVW